MKILYLTLIIFLAVNLSSCSIKNFFPEKKKNQSVLSINFMDTNHAFNNVKQDPLQVEIYFIRNAYWIGGNKTGQLTSLMKQLNIKESSKYEVVSYYTYEIISNKLLRDVISIEKNAQIMLIVLKEKDKLLSNKFVEISPSNVGVVNIELIGKQIKTIVSN